MSEPVNLVSRRWDKGDGSPNSHPAHEALELALHRVRSGEWKADHVMVIVGNIENGVGNVSFAQAGTFDSFGQEGLLQSAARLLSRQE